MNLKLGKMGIDADIVTNALKDGAFDINIKNKTINV